MALLRRPTDLRAPFPRAHAPRSLFRLCQCFALLAMMLASVLAPARPTFAAPQLSLPTPPGERWKVIQGYGCGTHTGVDQYALDLVNMDGATAGAPVRAAADGTIWIWVPKSGTLILSHGGGFYTQYTHLQNAASVKLDKPVKRGDVIGWAGDRATRGLPHLHFMAFYGKGIAASGRSSVPLSFEEGYDMPKLGGCNQHAGQVLVAGGKAATALPAIGFHSEAEVGRWYNSDKQVTFSGSGIAGGYSMAWGQEPGGDKPAQPSADNVSAQIAPLGEGLHTLYVRGWSLDGQQTLVTFGPFGYDVTPPAAPASIGTLELPVGKAADVQWTAAEDRASGVAGYRVYIGGDPNGTSDWFVPAPQVTTQPLEAGSYLLRVQSLDYAGNAGEWTTVGTLVAK